MTYDHQPVMAEKAVETMGLKPGDRVVDCCVGLGGHASLFLQTIRPNGFLLGTDLDAGAIEVASGRLKAHGARYELVHANYTQIPDLLAARGIDKVEAIFTDLGACSVHFDRAGRGFSLWHEGSLDMRWDVEQTLTAAQIVNQWSLARLEQLFRDYGDERQASQIAEAIVERRRATPIRTTRQLAVLIEQVKGRAKRGIHAGTKCFMALRMATNRELENLTTLLEAAPGILAPGGSFVCITYHSKEDKLVKDAFRTGRKEGLYSDVTRKPIAPSPREIQANPRARSAKLRRAIRLC